MHSVFFQNAYLLQSLGWAVISSFWQVGFLWLLYKTISGLHENISAVFKHNLGLTLLFSSTIWFVFTTIKTYSLLKISPTFFSFTLDGANVELWNKALSYLAFLYITILCIYFIRFINNYLSTNHLKEKKILKPSAAVRLFTKTTALHLGIKKNVQVWLSTKIDVPSVIGFIKPTILIPAATIIHLSPQQLEAVLLHELAHIKRNDYLLHLLQTIASLILFFNPFAIILNKHIKIERENCCDDWVLNYQYDQTLYANALLQIEKYRQQNIMLALAATNGKKQLLGRVQRLFSVEPNVAVNTFQKIQLVFVGLVLLVNIILFTPSKRNLNNQVTPTATIINKKSEEKNIQKNTVPYSSTNIIKNKPQDISTLPANKNISSRKNILPKNNDYSYTLINEELLTKNKESDYTILPVSDKKENESPKYFVKIEEEKSGAKNNNTYYFQLSQDSGKAALKPIIFINKPAKKITSKKLPDTSVMPGKRITT